MINKIHTIEKNKGLKIDKDKEIQENTQGSI